MVCRSWASADLFRTCGKWKKSLAWDQHANASSAKMAEPVRRHHHHIAVIRASTMWSASVLANRSRWKIIRSAVSVFSPTRFQKRHWRKNGSSRERQLLKFAAAVGVFFWWEAERSECEHTQQGWDLTPNLTLFHFLWWTLGELQKHFFPELPSYVWFLHIYVDVCPHRGCWGSTPM